MFSLFLLVLTVFGTKEKKERFFKAESIYRERFDAWTRDFNMTWDPKETLDRYDIFKDNIDHIERHNAKNLSWTMGTNQFSAMTADEFTFCVKKGHCGGYIHKETPESEMNYGNTHPNSTEYKAASCSSIDWRQYGAVTSVKNQGQCGSCWTFAVAAAYETCQKIAGNQIDNLSEQEILDCDRTDYGCNGGYPANAFKWIQQNGGICQLAKYNYVGYQQSYCYKSYCSNYGKRITKYTNVYRTEGGLQAAVCTGAVTVAIQADQQAFQFYKSGVLTGSCGTQLDHAVTVVGFGYQGNQQYWLIKNSWGTGWGDGGYIKLCKHCGANGGNGQCGILMQGVYPSCT